MILRTLLVLTLALAALVGCASHEDLGFKVLSITAPSAAVTAEEIYPVGVGAWTYLITAGDGRGAQVVHRRQATERYGADWADRQGDRRVEFWRRDEAGNIVMPVVVDHADRAITLFEPPLIIAYRELGPGAARRQEVAMRVMDERRPTRLRHEGTAVRTVEYVDDQLLELPFGTVETRRLLITFTADLKMADAETTSTIWVARDLGTVVVQEKDTVRALGIPIRGSSRTMVLEQ